MPLHVHPTDARIKCLTKEQVQQLAAAHGRPIELPPALASSPLVQACPQGMLETPRIRLSGLLVSFSFFFRFVGQQGRFSAYRKGRMSRRWSAYRTIHQHDYQHYLGTTDHLTIDCLEQMAAKLQSYMATLSLAELDHGPTFLCLQTSATVVKCATCGKALWARGEQTRW